jgi:phospholipid/cholesterol/gamma-HCH transport system substrate-binding protein
VDEIAYDFTLDTAFRVTISVAKEIRLPKGTEMVLCSDGLLSGMAIKLAIPTGEATDGFYEAEEMLPTSVEPGPMESLQEGLLTKVDMAVGDLDSLILDFRQQVKEGNLKKTLANAERITDDLIQTGQDLKRFTHERLPSLVNSADTALNSINDVAVNLREANLKGTVQRVNNAVDTIQHVLTSKEGTLGLLLNDKGLYTHIDSTVVSVDSLVTDLKANPKRYVHFSLFGGKDKKKK